MRLLWAIARSSRRSPTGRRLTAMIVSPERRPRCAAGLPGSTSVTSTPDRPVVVLVDGLTGSTAEIFSDGLKDLGRATIVGTRTGGAALPAVMKELPNGDGFLYAVANYVSSGGEELEGKGVIPHIEAPLTRKALLAGRDPALEEAIAVISGQRDATLTHRNPVN